MTDDAHPGVREAAVPRELKAAASETHMTATLSMAAASGRTTGGCSLIRRRWLPDP
jgi:hypothetical protein